jgi:hypothetical protein
MPERALREVRLDYRSFDEAYNPATKKLVRALSEVVLDTSSAGCDVESYLHSRTEEERKDLRRALKRLHKEEDLPRRPARSTLKRSESTPAAPRVLESGTPELLPYAQMLAQKYDRHMFQGTTYRDLGDWYLDHETGRDQIDLSGVKADKREVVTRLYGSDDPKAKQAYNILQNAARGVKFLERKSMEPKRTDYREGSGAQKPPAGFSRPKKPVPYPAASNVPCLEPKIWSKTAEEMTGPKPPERSSEELAAELMARRELAAANAEPKMPKRAAPLHDGEAGLALQHMNNVAKIGGFAKSSYKDQTNIVKFLTDSGMNRERSRHAKFDSRRPFLRGRRQPTIHDVSIAQASLPLIGSHKDA